MLEKSLLLDSYNGSSRKSSVFIEVNCAAPKELIESDCLATKKDHLRAQ